MIWKTVCIICLPKDNLQSGSDSAIEVFRYSGDHEPVTLGAAVSVGFRREIMLGRCCSLY